jgi:plasmid stabilization system protein ParE
MLPPNLSLWGKLASGWLVEQSRERPFTQKFGHILPAGKYLIYYRRTRRGTEILHVFHGSRNQMRAFKKAPNRE